MFYTEDEVVDVVRAHIETKFPKRCRACGTTFTCLADYLTQTKHIGEPISYDGTMENWEPEEPMGTFSMANCACGSTLSIGSTGMPRLVMLKLLLWAKVETVKRGITIGSLLEQIREKIDAKVLAEATISENAAEGY